jgi:hypothetical protein
MPVSHLQPHRPGLIAPEAGASPLLEAMPVRRLTLALLAAVALAVGLAAPASAGSAHFVDDQTSATVSADGSSLTADFKIGGLGDEDQVHVVLTADAACVNPGGNKPQAANKETFAAEGLFPVQNGHADGSLTVVAAFEPSCSPPMTVEWSNVVLTDTTSGISVNLTV